MSEPSFARTNFTRTANMLPYWIDLSIADLMQGSGFLAVAITMLTFHFLVPSGRA